jgi:hypothetical protein
MQVCASNLIENKWLLDMLRVAPFLPFSLDGWNPLASSDASLRVKLVSIGNWLLLEVSSTVAIFLPFSLSRRHRLASSGTRLRGKSVSIGNWLLVGGSFLDSRFIPAI